MAKKLFFRGIRGLCGGYFVASAVPSHRSLDKLRAQTELFFILYTSAKLGSNPVANCL